MKFCKRFFVYLLVAVVGFGSVMVSYQKASNCEAASIGLGIGFGILTVTGILVGAYLVADEEVQEEVKQSFVDYKNSTVEVAKVNYALNKQLFDNFVAYATAQGGCSALVYTSAGNTYTVDEMAAAGFPSFEKWDEHMKDSGSSSGGLKNIFDKIMLAADLISLMKAFCNNEFYENGIDGQLFYTGDDGYIDRSTGEVNIHFEIRDYYYDESTYDVYLSELNTNITDYDGGFGRTCSAENFRICAVAQSYISCKYWHYQLNWRVLNCCWSIYLNSCYSNGVLEKINIPCYKNCELLGDSYSTIGSFGLQFFNYDKGEYLVGEESRYFPDYISSNIPFFATWAEAAEYLSGASLEPLNLLSGTPSDVFIDNYSNTYVTTTNIIDDVNEYSQEPAGTPTPTTEPTATPEPLPVEQTVTNIYNFFTIDIDRISFELDFDFIPASKFTEINNVFTFLKNTTSEDTYDENGILITDYPKITMGVPEILLPFIGDAAITDIEGNKVIVLCDFADYAIYFVQFRGFLNAVIWIGMIFYILRQFQVVFSLS